MWLKVAGTLVKNGSTEYRCTTQYLKIENNMVKPLPQFTIPAILKLLEW
eukprot:SAG31_NODE_2087_length_6484_cov_5.038528_3_plen_49_part_00